MNFDGIVCIPCITVTSLLQALSCAVINLNLSGGAFLHACGVHTLLHNPEKKNKLLMIPTGCMDAPLVGSTRLNYDDCFPKFAFTVFRFFRCCCCCWCCCFYFAVAETKLRKTLLITITITMHGSDSKWAKTNDKSHKCRFNQCEVE